MSNNPAVISELVLERNKIKDEIRKQEGRAPAVCSDEALTQIAELMPRTKEELLCVSGIGKTFVDKYGDRFIGVIKRNIDKEEPKGSKLTTSSKKTLKELQNKLVNINRKNRLLYLSKITPKYAYDLFPEDGSYDPLDIIFKNKKIEVCSIKKLTDEDNSKKANNPYKQLVCLLREVNKDLREKGRYDLYIGYPFVEGNMSGEDFDVRAPLVLFPIVADRDSNSISLKLDTTKDIVYNTHLLLAYYKFNNISKPLPQSDIDEISEESFFDNIIEFFKTEGLKMDVFDGELQKFKEYTADTFPKYQDGELHISKNIVLGKFPTFSSSIQKDFDGILESDEINPLLAELLSSIDDLDFYQDNGETNSSNKEKSISEHSLTYINDLNSSQEDVLTAIKSKNALVVQGPPGTGKSQTITSLIADFVAGGSNVLMVSEKKAALDVVYSRLGELNRYAMLVDDVNDKQNFYSQVSEILNIHNQLNMQGGNISQVSDKIDSYVKTLDDISQKLYEENEFGIAPYKLYLMSTRYNLTNMQDEKKYRTIKSHVDDKIFKAHYNEIETAYDSFHDDELLEKSTTYLDAIKECSYVNSLKESIGDYDLLTCKDKAVELSKAIDDWRKKGGLSKLFSKGKVTKILKEFEESYTTGLSKADKKRFLKEGFNYSALENYENFIIAKPVFLALSEFQKLYFSQLIQVVQALNCDKQTANEELFNLIICNWLFSFEAQNRNLLQGIANFPNIVSSLSKLISEKKTLTRSSLENLMYNNLGSILNSKRQGEIARIVESTRKWSVNKFLKKFSFELFRSINIWLLTPEVASEILPLKSGLFDLVIFDEASQMYVEKGVPSIQRAKKVVIAGDSKQLRPSNLGNGRLTSDEDDDTTDNEENAALEEESLLDVARFKYLPPVTLNYHYRAKYEELIAFSNYAFYHGNLCVSPNVTTLDVPPIEVHKIDDGSFINRQNPGEAKKIILLLKEFFKTRQHNESIGIITFNSNQRDLIEDMLDDECAKDAEFSASVKAESSRKDHGEDIGLFVKNIENVQGDERDVIIFSIGYAKNENGVLIKNFGWLNQKGGENRLNVAISRAKTKIHIVTSFEPVELKVDNTKNDGPKYLRKYLEYCFAISSRNTALAKEILNSLSDLSDATNSNDFKAESKLQNEVVTALLNKGYEVDTNVGIGGYSIDIAVKKGENYLVGIECDGKLYRNSKSTRERDYHRGKYLESRGWKVYRIWSPNWWKDKDKEISKIEALINI